MQKITVTQLRMARMYLLMVKDEISKANRYSWKRWEYYNRLRLARAHKYAERLNEFFVGGKLFSNRESAANLGAGHVTEKVEYPTSDEHFAIENEFNTVCENNTNFYKHIARGREWKQELLNG